MGKKTVPLQKQATDLDSVQPGHLGGSGSNKDGQSGTLPQRTQSGGYPKYCNGGIDRNYDLDD